VSIPLVIVVLTVSAAVASNPLGIDVLIVAAGASPLGVAVLIVAVVAANPLEIVVVLVVPAVAERIENVWEVAGGVVLIFVST
jgi:hypothetical protein